MFIRGFRVTRKYMIFPRLKGAAGPNPDPERYDSDEEANMELIPIPAVPEVMLRTFVKFSNLHYRFHSIGILFTYYNNSSLR